MNINSFLKLYTNLAKEVATTEDIDLMYFTLNGLTKGTVAEFRFEELDTDRLEKALAIDYLAHEFHSENPGLLDQVFPGADYEVVKKTLDRLAGLECETEIRKSNRGFFTELSSPLGLSFIEKQAGPTQQTDISADLREYSTLFKAQSSSRNNLLSDAELLTLHRAYPTEDAYLDMVKSRGLDQDVPTVVGGYASVEVIDREGHLITVKALKKAFYNFMKSFRTRNIMIAHTDVQVGWPLPAYINEAGQVFKSGVDDRGLYLISEIRPDTEIANKVRRGVNDGIYKSYSIAGTALEKKIVTKGDKTFMQVDKLELAEITICEKPVNQDSNFNMLKSNLLSKAVTIDEVKKLGDAIGLSWKKYDIEQFRQGVSAEREHLDTVGNSMETIAKIAQDHMDEDPQYYMKLKAVEAKKWGGWPVTKAKPEKIVVDKEKMGLQILGSDLEKLQKFTKAVRGNPFALPKQTMGQTLQSDGISANKTKVHALREMTDDPGMGWDKDDKPNFEKLQVKDAAKHRYSKPQDIKNSLDNLKALLSSQDLTKAVPVERSLTDMNLWLDENAGKVYFRPERYLKKALHKTMTDFEIVKANRAKRDAEGVVMEHLTPQAAANYVQDTLFNDNQTSTLRKMQDFLAKQSKKKEHMEITVVNWNI